MRETRGLVFLICLFISAGIFSPAFANPLVPTMTRVLITQDGIPVDGAVNFSLDCYGSYRYPLLYRTGSDVKNDPNLSDNPDPVYNYATTCSPSEMCYIYKPDTDWKVNISHCDLSGTYKGQPFLMENFSRESMLSTKRKIVWMGAQHEAYTLTDRAYTGCYNQKYLRDQACYDNYRKANASTGFSESTPEFRKCQNTSAEDLFDCIKNNGTKINNTEAKYSDLYYELRFDIPSENHVMKNGNNPDGISPELPGLVFTPSVKMSPQAITSVSPSIRRSLAESLYCNIASIFGAPC